jgi:hypothetical protein
MKQRTLCGDSGRPSPAIYLLVAVFSILYISSADIYAQTPKGNTEQASNIKKTTPSQEAPAAPLFKEYRKVSIGMAADTLRDAWGKPANEYSDGLFYEMSDSETIQIVIGPEKKVTAIAVTFIKGKGAPPFADVFGEGVTPEKRENGSVYRLVRYPDAGYWVAYYAGPGEKADVSVTMQKL